MKNYFISEKIEGQDKLVIFFKNVTLYKRIKNMNNNQWAFTDIHVNENVIRLYDVGFTDPYPYALSIEECERFDKEYMAWLESEGGK